VIHLRRNAGVSLNPLWNRCPWYYLSGFYSREPGTGGATRALRAAIRTIGEPIVLCCEPILGSDPRSLTPKTEHLDPETRTAGLCNYYRAVHGLVCEAPARCTLRTQRTGAGKRWSEPDRTFMWSSPVQQKEMLRCPFLGESLSVGATSGSSIKRFDHPNGYGFQRIQELN
jgi:hypothetical protein